MPDSPSLFSRLQTALAQREWQTPVGAPTRLDFQAPRIPAAVAPIQTFAQEPHTLLLADATQLVPLGDDPSFDAIYHRFLDLTLPERVVLATAARGARFALIAGAHGARLLDTVTELPLATWKTDDETDPVDLLLAPIDAVGAGRSLPAPDHDALSEDLARWFELLGGGVGPALGWSRLDTQRLGYQLILGLKILADGTLEDHATLGLTTEADGDTIRARWSPPATAQWVDTLLAAAHTLAPQAADTYPLIERRGIARQLESAPESALRALAGLWQLAAAKRRPDVMLGLLTSPNHEHAAWRLALTEPLDVAQSIAITDFYVYQPLELDLAEVGFGRVLEAIEQLARLALERDATLQRAGGRQLDLIEPPPEGLAPDAAALADPFNWLLSHALRLRVAHLYRNALGYLIALHIADLRSRPPFSAYPPTPLTSLPTAIAVPSTDE